MMSIVRRAVLALGLPVVLVAAWWFATEGSQSFFWPPLRDILGTFAETWWPDRIMGDVVPSLLRLLVGFAIAFVLGVGLGVAIGKSRALRAYLEPVLEFFRAIPPPVLVPILILFFGIFNTMKVVVIVTGCIWPILLNTVEGVRSLDEVLIDTSKIYRLSRRARLWYNILPGASPQIFAGARQALSVGIILMVISEMFAASNGIGFTIIQFQRTFAIPQMFSGIIVLGLLGVALALVFRLVETRILRWYLGLRAAQRGE
ncbi:nitrate ABC transporter permease [Intrasporangium chromatireducens Q5-1]|uniref:Nitrate ABC transporter permease n=2 Tax=Intrasporangium TaxID=53357 RepID=W9GGT4_9MICO|nr:nitrate ABC transporter permease [Intrasporangium chromatireducens Q5-1]